VPLLERKKSGIKEYKRGQRAGEGVSIRGCVHDVILVSHAIHFTSVWFSRHANVFTQLKKGT